MPNSPSRLSRLLSAASFALFSCGIFAAGCGARSSTFSPENTGPAPEPIALFVSTGCAEHLPVDKAAEELATADSGQGIAIVEIFYADECTDLGGHYVLAREVDGSRRFWLGGHGCSFLTATEQPSDFPQFGVLRYSQTAALFQIPPDVCISFPGEISGIQSDSLVEAIAVFATLDDAETFAAALPE